MEENPARPVLDEEEIKRCHDIVDELVRLHKETDPVHGQQSEDYKVEKAYQALNQVGLLTAILTEWAEAQIMGCYYQIAKSDAKWIDDTTSNRHENELMWHGELPKNLFTNDDYLMCQRTALAVILHNTFGRYGVTGWRMALSESLQALNEGQIDWLLTPTNTKLQGNAYDLSNLKWAAIQHLYKLIGEGWKKTAAQQEIAGCCGTTFEAIKKWEKQCIKERDPKKIFLKLIQFCASLRAEVRNLDGYSDSNFLYEAVTVNINTKAPLHESQKDVSAGSVACIMLDREFPLKTLGARLAKAGMRKAD